ncbi:peptidoglycan-binding protein [Caulobacter sp. UNC279MFTsu5.1]|uniref:peptidoglycan-binding protein n=1 Tax=Caulobacter sp. UNC279MFTsu5.1 TaxID=1502775 RepID=UPI0008EADA36|nr:peptidoglycan-binding protein [Caulobacter sp. UNC279MFTsu5.1]SFJ56650.1 localization factor PodJL [Caulobacter sp. UNC279MFTsu5.1]
MTAAAPWSVKGIDPKAREVAKDLARRSGMTLGEWLNRMIIEGEGFDAASLEAFGEPSRPSLAVNNDRANPSYYETARGGAPSRIEAREHPADEVGRVAVALDRLTDRIEAAEKRSAQAISGIDESVRGALQRLVAAEREQVAVAARFEGAVDDIKTDQARAAERLRRIEAEAAGPRSAEALRALEGALGKVAGHLYEGEARTRETIAHLEQRLDNQAGAGVGDPSALVEEVVARLGQRLEAAEARTSDALQALNASFSALDGRLRTVESSNPGEGVQKRLDDLAGSLTQRMEAARLEMAAKLRESADGRFDRMERKLGEMTAHVQAAEQRSAQAIERMGREVVGMADALNRRVQTSEARNTAAIEQVAASIDQKLNRADSVQAQALEKLGTEIARITEKLAERISNAERRNALAIDDVGDQVTRVTDRLNQRHERTSQELVDRIRQSEERTARLLEEAREKIDTRLAEAQRRAAEQAAVAAAAPPPARPAPSPFDDGERFSFGGEEVPEDVFHQPAAFIPPHAPSPASTPARTAAPAVVEAPVFEAPAFPASEPPALEFGDEDFEAADGFASALEPETAFEPADDHDGDFSAPEFASSDFAAPQESAAPSRPLSTREVIEQARAAARQAALSGDAKGKDKPKAKKAGTSLFAGFGAKGSEKKAKKGGMKTALMVSATAACLGVGSAGVIMSMAQGSGPLPERVAEGTSNKATGEIRAAEADTSPAAARAAVALTSQAPVEATTISTEAAPLAVASPGENAQALYDDGVRRIEAKDRTGLESLRKAANLGLPRAQFYLAKMYEVGEGGVKKDLAEARRWTERAATAGEARAMHNLALYYYKGEGGERNSTKAASWFRKASDLGLVDSQFNLAQLYEGGWGVSQNPTEAYKWYLIAARSGDTASRARAMALRSQLTAEGQRIAERSASGFRSQAAAPVQAVASAAAPSAGLATAQRALSKLGYYQGPQDGVASPALQMAIAAYQRDQNLQASGALDGETLSRLSTWAR